MLFSGTILVVHFLGKEALILPMQEKQTPKTEQKLTVSPFDLFLMIVTVFEVLLLVIVLSRSFVSSAPPVEQPDNQETQTQTPPEDEISVPSKPVFSQGVLPTRPEGNADTVPLTTQIHSQYAILIDAETGMILAQKGADVAFSPASMTKVMTLIVACEQLTEADLTRKLAFTEQIYQYVTSGDYLGTETALPLESNGYSCLGDTYTIKDLLYGIGVMSAADCTYMIAREVAGSEEAFVALMNRKAQELGLTDTHFNNAVGFDSEENVTSAKDMAMIMDYAMQSALIADILRPRLNDLAIDAHFVNDSGVEKTYSVQLKPSWKSRINRHPDFHLSKVTLDAVKTGFTDTSFIVCSATGKESNKRYIVVLGDAATIKDTMLDLEWLYNTYAQ